MYEALVGAASGAERRGRGEDEDEEEEEEEEEEDGVSSVHRFGGAVSVSCEKVSDHVTGAHDWITCESYNSWF